VQTLKAVGHINAGNKVFVQSSLRLPSTQKQGSGCALHLAFVFQLLAVGFLTAVPFLFSDEKEKAFGRAVKNKNHSPSQARLRVAGRPFRRSSTHRQTPASRLSVLGGLPAPLAAARCSAKAPR
jgi:hypothetical protein